LGDYARFESIRPAVVGADSNTHAGQVFTGGVGDAAIKGTLRVQWSAAFFTKFLDLSWSLRARSKVPVALKHLAIDSNM
jgi:hypothetical protein